MYLILGSVGLGSALLHSTLHWLPQSSDEVPMLWQSLSFTFALITLRNKPQDESTRWLGIVFIVIGIVQTAIYYRFQQVYIIFLLTLAFISFLNTAWMTHLAVFDGSSEHQRIRKRLLLTGVMCFLVFGLGPWLLDFHACDQLSPYYLALPYYLQGVTLHVLWHFFSAFGAYCGILFLVAVRLQRLGVVPKIKRLCGIFPIIVAGTKQPEKKN